MSGAKHPPGPLDYDPFQGDFGVPGDRTLSDSMVKARKAHQCSHCAGPIVAGETYRARSDIADGDLMTWKWCALCCAAMVEESAETEDEAKVPSFPFEKRYAIARTTESST